MGWDSPLRQIVRVHNCAIIPLSSICSLQAPTTHQGWHLLIIPPRSQVLFCSSLSSEWDLDGKEREQKQNTSASVLSNSVQRSWLIIGMQCSSLANEEQSDLLNCFCFGRPIMTTEKDKKWFQFTMEEAFYLTNSLKCLRIIGENDSHPSDEEIWLYMVSKKSIFLYFYKAYHHLRVKNWVVRMGSQYGVDFVAYQHHPRFVHSEYAVVVLFEGDGDMTGRLRVWSDFHCTIRLCGSVAKTLLALYIKKHGHDSISPMLLDNCCVKECTIMRWSPEKCREDHSIEEKGTK